LVTRGVDYAAHGVPPHIGGGVGCRDRSFFGINRKSKIKLDCYILKKRHIEKIKKLFKKLLTKTLNNGKIKKIKQRRKKENEKK
jgi:hypothetical protein